MIARDIFSQGLQQREPRRIDIVDGLQRPRDGIRQRHKHAADALRQAAQ